MLRLIVELLADIKWLILKICTEKRLLFIFLLSSFPLGLVFLDGARTGCRVYTNKNVHTADCSLLDMAINVPNDLDPGIEMMNLSGNHLINISDKSFERYKDNLVTLDLSNMTHVGLRSTTYDDRSFIGLRKLEYLDISHSCIARHKFRFPGSLKVLKMERCELFTLNFSHMRTLEELHAASCNLLDLPLFHKQAPIQILDLRHNHLTKLRVETIAPFCQLKQMRLKMIEGEGLQSPKMFCQCAAVDAWLTNVGVEHERLNCTKKDKKKKAPIVSGLTVTKSETENVTLNLHTSDNKTPNCVSTPSDAAMQMRRECMARVSPSIVRSVKTNWMLIGIVFAAVMSLLIPSFVYSRRRLRNIKQRNEAIEHDHEEEYDEELEESEAYHGYHEGYTYDYYH